MSKEEIISTLYKKGYKNIIVHKRGGIEIRADKRIPLYEFDYWEFIRVFDGKIDTKKVHMLDNWTFTIECE